MRGAIVSLLLLGAGATELTKENFDSATAGKTVFIKFQAPWCGHCKSMKPAWDKLMGEFEGNPTVLVGDADCTAGGKELCNDIGVKGYPTIKHGDPADLQDYKGGRSFDDLKKFAGEMKPSCSPKNIDLCDDEKKKQIGEFKTMGAEKREETIKEQEGTQEKLEKDFKEFVEGLQKSYQEASDKKDKEVAAIKDSGLGLLKAVHAFEKTAKSEL